MWANITGRIELVFADHEANKAIKEAISWLREHEPKGSEGGCNYIIDGSPKNGRIVMVGNLRHCNPPEFTNTLARFLSLAVDNLGAHIDLMLQYSNGATVVFTTADDFYCNKEDEIVLWKMNR